VKFKVFDSKKKVIVKNDKMKFFMGEDSILYCSDMKSGIAKCRDEFIPVFSIDKIDKNGVELFQGDQCKCEDGIVREIIIHQGSSGFKGKISDIVHQTEYELSYVEKIGSKYES
jgi:hypothetical protein